MRAFAQPKFENKHLPNLRCGYWHIRKFSEYWANVNLCGSVFSNYCVNDQALVESTLPTLSTSAAEGEMQKRKRDYDPIIFGQVRGRKGLKACCCKSGKNTWMKL